MPTNPPLEIVFCADRNMLAALHVAAKSVLQKFTGIPSFTVLTDSLRESDFDLLRETLNSLQKEYSLKWFNLDAGQFNGFPKSAGTYSAYFRLLIADSIEASRCLYLDSDILCLGNLSELVFFDLQESPLALVPEAMIENCADTQVFKLLSNNAKGHYFNSGVALIDCKIWRAEGIKGQCIDFIAKHNPKFWDQSALNFVLHHRIRDLTGKFNFQTNVRANWPLLRKPRRGAGCLLHFVDYPKPWSAMGRWIHPFGQQWWGEYRKTAHFQKNRHKPAPMRWDAKTRLGYRKVLKDKLLFSLYDQGLILPKGVPAS
jgi:lipopolysaccharide biosynthesis glycosyltransferase